ncbi:unnamed protein product [Prorocentrum cordatum]|uniref:Methyltransferase FkbM domain-containing protein n=1 Tax=Prorocentrum cordatum TaxID=2364126 RepID=A0ABN9WTJ8_9DINO|nr:unnamed protein product [Polarella glacialis]
MASLGLCAVACAVASLRAAALTLPQHEPEPLSLAQASPEHPIGDPRPADLARWSSGPLTVEASTLHHAEVRSLVGGYNLSIAAFDRWADSMVSAELLAGNGWETRRVSELCRLYREGGAVGNFLDVGANIGTFTIPLADCLSGSGRVLAVEGMPPTADHLVAGILESKLKNVDVYTYAVGAPEDPKRVVMSLNPVNKGGSAVQGTKPFTNMTDDQLQHLFHPGKKEQKYAKKVVVEEFSVQLTTGDHMLWHNPGMKAIAIAKVDIEGYEGRFIRGAQQLFSKYPPCFMTIELIPEWLERAGTPVQEILDQLTRWDYKNVPTLDELRRPTTDSKTRTVEQRDMAKCMQRVRSYASQQ